MSLFTVGATFHCRCQSSVSVVSFHCTVFSVSVSWFAPPVFARCRPVPAVAEPCTLCLHSPRACCMLHAACCMLRAACNTLLHVACCALPACRTRRLRVATLGVARLGGNTARLDRAGPGADQTVRMEWPSVKKSHTTPSAGVKHAVVPHARVSPAQPRRCTARHGEAQRRANGHAMPPVAKAKAKAEALRGEDRAGRDGRRMRGAAFVPKRGAAVQMERKCDGRCRSGPDAQTQGADVAGASPNPGADVAGVSPVPVQMWQG